jgi:hypothetical protein
VIAFVRERDGVATYYPPLTSYRKGPWSVREVVVFGFGIAWSVKAS